MTQTKTSQSKVLNSAVVVSALGYFVDIYDLVLFSIVRIPSLKGLQIPEGDLLNEGVFLLNMQMSGMLIGGLLWGIWGDKKGRVSVLFGSIFLYSLANLLNAFVVNLPQYGALRFIAGIGLAGELGAAITLVSEVMTKETRGYGTTVVASVGILGALLAGYIGEHYTWQTAYIIGGVLGFTLLILRITTFESSMFESIRRRNHRRGDFFMLFNSKARMIKYACTILIGLPIWYVIGILITFSPELAKELSIETPIIAGKAIVYCYAGLSIGDLSSGLLSQYLKSRRKSVFIFLVLTAIGVFSYPQLENISDLQFYYLCGFLGFGTGYWAIFVSSAAEQFGTNLRSTVTTTVPNFIRGSVVPMTIAFQYLSTELKMSQLTSAFCVGSVSVAIALIALYHLPETYGQNLDYIDE